MKLKTILLKTIFIMGVTILLGRMDTESVIAALVIGMEDSETEITPIPTETPIPEETITPTPEPIKNGLVKENGYYRYYKDGVLQKNVWKKLNNRKYYFMSNGNAATYSKKIGGEYYIFNTKGQLLTPSRDKILQVGTYKFYVTTKGRPVTGWKIYNNNLYYMHKSGRCAANTMIDGVTLTKDCWAKNDTNAQLKRKVIDTIAKITTSKMSKNQKLRACFNYTTSSTFHYGGWKYPDFSKKYWQRTCALDMLNTKVGNCFGYGCAFAALAEGLGYEPYIIDGDLRSRHSWVRIDGKYYDRYGNYFGVEKYPRKYTVRKITKF